MNRTILGIVSLALAIILGGFVLWPKIAAVRQVNIDKKVALARVKQKENRRDGLRSLSTLFETRSQEVDSLLESLPTEPEIPDVLVTIESLSSQSGLVVDSISPTVDKSKQLVTVGLNGTADLGALERFFQAISENRRPLSVSQVSLSKSQSGSSLTYNCVVSFAYINEPVATAPSASASGQSTTTRDQLE